MTNPHRTPREVPAQAHVDPPPGWPRPYSRPVVDGEPQPPQYLQWISGFSGDQITACHEHRTWAAGVYNLCSSCGTLMEKGLVFDRDWVNANVPAAHYGRPAGEGGPGGHLGRLMRKHTHFGSPLCLRCAVFALKHCPMFAVFQEVFGDELVWLLVEDVTQYHEFDDTSGIEVTDPNAHPRATTAWVRREVRAGRLHLVDGVTVDRLPPVVRPPDFVDGEPNRIWEHQPKVPLEAVRRLAGRSRVPV